ncbi:MAG TPA: sialidase family protein, partial [Actinomycetota bacterium]|nr:sialidase family protein [Actinomycetota bacterium]
MSLRVRLVLTAALLALPATQAPRGPAEAPGSGTRLPATGEMMDAELPEPLSLGFISRRLPAENDADVRVNAPAAVGDPAACHIQSEATVAVDRPYVYVGFNDTRQCTFTLGLPGVRRSMTGFARSTDGGQTFEDLGPLVPNGPIHHLVGDPVIAVDTEGEGAGTVYVSSLAHIDVYDQLLLVEPHSTVAVGVSTDRGRTFTWHDAVGERSRPGILHDKEWLAVDNSGGRHDGNVYLAWSEWPADFSQVRLLFTRSSDRGQSWSTPLEIAVGFPMAPQLAVGPDGEVHLAWREPQ